MLHNSHVINWQFFKINDVHIINIPIIILIINLSIVKNISIYSDIFCNGRNVSRTWDCKTDCKTERVTLSQ